MKFKILSAFLLSVLLSCVFCVTALAGTYTVTQYISGSFGTPNVTVTNSAGAQHTGGALWLSSTVTNVTQITQTVRLDSVTSGSALYFNVFYSTDGVNFVIGTTIYCPLNTEVSYTMNFGSPKTIKAFFYLPNTSTWPGYGYTVWTPLFTRTLTDNTAPIITLSQQNYYSKSYVTVTASVSDSESGVSVKKWAQGYQSASYFNSSGTTFTGSYFYPTSNGYYTVYAKDVAGNVSVNYIYITMLDISPPSITATTSTEYDLTNTVTATITDSQSGVYLKKWAYGYYSSSYFASSGTTFTGSSFTVTQNGYVTVYAKDAVGNEAVYYVLISYIDNTISIVHPVSVNYSLNPNLLSPFSSNNILITNNSRIKVKVSIQSLTAITGGSNVFTDVAPDYFSNWNILTATQTKQYIALGVQVADTVPSSTGWYSISNSNILYAAQITGPNLLGILNPNGATGTLRMNARYGLAWDDDYTAAHNLTLLFQTE